MEPIVADDLSLLAEVARHSPDAYLLVQADGTITWASPQVPDLLGYRPDELVGSSVDVLVPEHLRAAHVRHRAGYRPDGPTAMGGGRYLQGRRADGSSHPFDIRLSSVGGGDLLVVLRDASDRKALEDELVAMATTDPLTGLANRRAMMAHLEEALARTRRRGDHMAVCYLDLDGFKATNDEHGHEAGDLVLVSVARALLHAVRVGDVIGRIGGDEFVVVLEELGADCDHAEALAGQVAERAVEALHQPAHYAGIVLEPQASVGVVVATGQGAEDGDDLLRGADAALYLAKSDPDRRVVVAHRRT